MDKNKFKEFVNNYNMIQDRIEAITNHFYKKTFKVDKFSKSVLGRVEILENTVFVGILETQYNEECHIKFPSELVYKNNWEALVDKIEQL